MSARVAVVMNSNVVLRLTEISVRWTTVSWIDAMAYAVQPLVIRAARQSQRRTRVR